MRMKKIFRKQIFLLPAAAAAVVFSVSCTSGGRNEQNARPAMQYRINDPTPEELAAMTPEQREVHENLRRAREQYRARQKIDSRKKQNTKPPVRKEEKRDGGFMSNLWKRNSVEKRKNLGDMSQPVLLNETKSSVMPWKTSGPRSERLHQKYIESDRYQRD